MTTHELAKRCRVTHRAIQWWAERGVIYCARGRRACGGGPAREFDDRQALHVAVIAELRRKGVSLQQIAPLVGELRRQHADYLVTDGRSVLWCAHDDVIPCVQVAQRGCHVVCLNDLRTQLRIH